ncbi:hypothetical protein [Flavobacterium saccharophilum]|uniref:Uncharacterized protein n=1 Tax=Flavobacterium saccharophilum TaxID=29534 RepID=A0A1M7GEI3_9FLAO|nr:hypothetical protein [Flavobacterium saccharophilum]SHM14528.1 hypothetical protein SAMN05444366_2515 [Flavobacterium saccharophilum]
MKKLILLSAFALLFTIFSCTPDEIETQPKKKIEKITNPIQAEIPIPGGPGDTPTTPPPPPTKP